MFTIFFPEQDQYAREMVSRHLSYERGEWNLKSVRNHQLAGLRATLKHVTSGSSFYARHLKDHLETIDEIDFDTLANLPFTTKDDLRLEGLNMLSRPITDAWIFYETTGTTGRSTPCPRDNHDTTATNTALTVNYASVLRKHPGNHFVAVLGPTELHSTGDAFGEVFHNLGHAVVKMWPHSPVVGYRRALEVMREYGVTAMVCTPGMAMSLAREARSAGLIPARDFGLRFIMVVGELVTPGLLENIRSIWSAEVYNCMYASQETSILGAVRGDGLVRTVPLNNLYEVVDPQSGEAVVPDSDGASQGELVITHLFQGCKPLVRYRTGDMVRLTPTDPGSEYPSEILTPLGRARDTLRLGGREFHAYELEQAILGHVVGCCGYQVVVDQVNGADTIEVVLEYLDPASADVLDVDHLRTRVSDALGIVPEVRTGEIGTIATTGAMVSWKASRVHDKRVPDDAERRAALAIARRRDGTR
jgi:phenylacetate-CoA ligase